MSSQRGCAKVSGVRVVFTKGLLGKAKGSPETWMLEHGSGNYNKIRKIQPGPWGAWALDIDNMVGLS